MSSPRPKRSARLSNGDMRYTPFVDERGRQHEPVDKSRDYVPSDGEDESPTFSSPSLKRRKIQASVTVRGARGDSVEVRIPARAAPDVAPTIPTNRASQDANISREQSKTMSSSELKEAALAKEKQEKVELEARYDYDFDIVDTTGKKRWFITWESKKTPPEKVYMLKDSIPHDRRLFVEWDKLSMEDRRAHDDSFKSYLDAKMPGFTLKLKKK